MKTSKKINGLEGKVSWFERKMISFKEFKETFL